MYEDKTLVCKECGNEFIFTAGEQEFYAEKGFMNEPQRCKECRQNRKNNERAQREYYTAVCAACGQEAKVPFKPRNDRPIYCSECFALQKENESGGFSVSSSVSEDVEEVDDFNVVEAVDVVEEVDEVDEFEDVDVLEDDEDEDEE